MPTKDKPKTKAIPDLEREAKLAEAAKLSAMADLLTLQDELGSLMERRQQVSVKESGGRTEAMRKLEKLDKETAQLNRSIALAETAVSELAEDLAHAENRLSEARAAEADANISAKGEEYCQARLEFEDALNRLAAARKAVLKTHAAHQSALRGAGHEVTWTDIDMRMAHRIGKRLGVININPALLAAPAPALASAKKGGER